MKESKLTKNQKKTFTKTFTERGEQYKITAEVRFDDECGNGHNSFAITGEVRKKIKGVSRFMYDRGGCIHDDITKHFPELAPLLKWHLCSTDGPTHYIAYTTYLAGDKDCWGLRKGEKRQIVNGRTGLPAWHLVTITDDGEEIELHHLKNKSIDAAERPTTSYRLEYRPWCRVGEGKEPDLEAARASAIWSEATLEQLRDKDALAARLPALLEEFRAAVESLGFEW